MREEISKNKSRKREKCSVTNTQKLTLLFQVFSLIDTLRDEEENKKILESSVGDLTDSLYNLIESDRVL